MNSLKSHLSFHCKQGAGITVPGELLQPTQIIHLQQIPCPGGVALGTAGHTAARELGPQPCAQGSTS